MKKTNKIYVALSIVSLIIIGVASFSRMGLAATITAETTVRTGNCGPISQYATSYPFSYYVQRFNHFAPQNNLSKLDVNFLGRNPLMQVTFNICEGTISNTLADATCTGAGQKMVSTSSTVTIASSTGAYSWIPAEPVKIDAQDNYFFAVTKATNFAMNLYQNGQAGQTCYTYGVTYPATGWTPSWLDSRGKAMDFTTYYDDTYHMPANLQVQLDTPADGSTYYQASLYFSGMFRDDSQQAKTLVIQVFNKDLNQTIQKSFALASSTFRTGARTFGPTGSDLVTYLDTPYDLPGNSYWTAWLSSSTVIVSTGTPRNNFFVGTTTNPIYQNLNFSAADVCYNDDLSSITGQFSCAFKTAMAWCFYPSQASLDTLNSNSQGLKNAFPFNVYFQLTTTVTNTIASTTMDKNGTIGVPMIRTDRTIYVLPVLSSSSMPNLIGQTNTTLIRNSLIWIMWLLVAVAIFFEIRNL